MDFLAYKKAFDSLQLALLSYSSMGTELEMHVHGKFCTIIPDGLTVEKIKPGEKCTKSWTPEC